MKKCIAILLAMFVLSTAACASAPKPAPSTEVTGTLEELMAQIYAGVSEELPVVDNREITDENSQYYLGIDLSQVQEALASEAMISSIAHSVCLLRAKEDTDIEALKTSIKENVDPNKWVCVGVAQDHVIVDNIGNLIILIMDDFAPEQLHDAFLALATK